MKRKQKERKRGGKLLSERQQSIFEIKKLYVVRESIMFAQVSKMKYIQLGRRKRGSRKQNKGSFVREKRGIGKDVTKHLKN